MSRSLPKRALPLVAILSTIAAQSGCTVPTTSDDTTEGDLGAGGAISAGGGDQFGTGGASTSVGDGGSLPGGGSFATGGASDSVAAIGGGISAGGTGPNGGNSSGGGPVGAGGTSGGGATGGASSGGTLSGGTSSGGTSSGGTSSGGTSGGSTGGAGLGGSPAGSGGAAIEIPDHDAADAIATCVDSLPWGQSEFAKNKAEIQAAIINTCSEFAPPDEAWQTYCQMFLTVAINKESSYNAQSVVEDAYGGASDPTVGLLQIRFSSTVKDYVTGGNLAAMDRIGCDLSGVNSSGTGAAHLSLMQNPTCNIALGAWYYLLYATGNGGASVTYLYDYCQGRGTGANLIMGMLSHLKGPSGAVSAFKSGNYDDGGYVDTITEWFDGCMSANGFPIGTPHPFQLVLSPEPTKYCSE